MTICEVILNQILAKEPKLIYRSNKLLINSFTIKNTN